MAFLPSWTCSARGSPAPSRAHLGMGRAMVEVVSGLRQERAPCLGLDRDQLRLIARRGPADLVGDPGLVVGVVSAGRNGRSGCSSQGPRGSRGFPQTTGSSSDHSTAT
jgi:hypothetical protein